jgi:hypothetical protein
MEMQQVVEMLEKLLANQNEDRDRMEAIQTKLDSNQAKMDKKLKEINVYQEKAEANMAKLEEKMVAKLEAEMAAIQAKTKAIHERMMAKLNTHQERPMAHPGTTQIDPVRRMMPSAEEHHEIPNREAAVMPVRGLKEQRMVCNLAAKHCQRKQEGTRETCGSKKFATACRGIARRARVVWRKRVVIKKNWTHRNFGLLTVLTAARRRMTCSAKVAWCRRQNDRTIWEKKPRNDEWTG